jgi:alanine racemase
MVRFAGAELVVFPAAIDRERPRTLAHLARCACAILRRETADTIRVGRVAFGDTPVPSKDSITEIAWYNFSTRN